MEILNTFLNGQAFGLVELRHWDFLRHHKYDQYQTWHDGTDFVVFGIICGLMTCVQNEQETD